MYTHAVITWTKVHYLLTQSQWDALQLMEPDSEIQIDGGWLKANNIADRLTIDKYYETYPDKRPEEVRNDFKENYGNLTQGSYTDRAKAIMKKAFIEQQLSVGHTQEEAEERYGKVFKGKMKKV